MAAVALALPVAAQDVGGLFKPFDVQGHPLVRADEEATTALRSTNAVPTRGGETVRQRERRIDIARLAGVREMIDSDKGAAFLDLNLFDDVVLKVVDLESRPTMSGGYSLAGRLHGGAGPLGSAVLVVNDNVVMGSVRSASGTYAIDCRERRCHIREVDPSKLAPDAHSRQTTAGTGASEPGGDTNDEPPVIDVLVVYTPAAREKMTMGVEAQIELFVAETNQAFADSDVNVRVALTRTAEVDYVESDSSWTDLVRLTNRSDGHMDTVHELRDETGSDLVHLIAEIQEHCGIAVQMMRVGSYFESEAFGITKPDCGGLTFAHELGHNMGAHHDSYVEPGLAAYPYSYGYVNQRAFQADAGESSRWRTVMAYPDQCEDSGFDCPPLLRFSNPEQEHKGDPLGVESAADVRRSLNNTAQTVAAFRSKVVLDISMTVEDTSVWKPESRDYLVVHDLRVHREDDRQNDPVPSEWVILDDPPPPLEFDSVRLYSNGDLYIDVDHPGNPHSVVSAGLDASISYRIVLEHGGETYLALFEGDISDVRITPDSVHRRPSDALATLYGKVEHGDEVTATVKSFRRPEVVR